MTLSSIARAFAVAIALSAFPAAHAETNVDARHLMENSGMVAEYAPLGDVVKAMVTRAGDRQGMPAQVAETVGEAARKALDGARLLAAIEVALESKLKPEQVTTVDAFYNTDLGGRVRQAEAIVAGVEPIPEIESRRDELLAKLKSDPERLALAERIDAALSGTELSAAIAESISYATVASALELGVGLGPAARTQLLAQIEGMHDQFLQQVHQDLLVIFSFAYAGISNDDMRAYADFLDTAEFRAVFATVATTVQDFVEAGGETMVNTVAAEKGA